MSFFLSLSHIHGHTDTLFFFINPFILTLYIYLYAHTSYLVTFSIYFFLLLFYTYSAF
ncbi:uncharacterized protein BX664DRAFT_327458, partial [Halteromyces radiatus]|uniref:uncharacterized protein n=1 Tax=Halteromyces radiatus TaxID=101107 RepID=UPI0022201E2A